MKLWLKTFIGLFLGFGVGVLLKISQLPMEKEIFSYFKLAGDLFMRLIQMLLPLLLFSSMIVGVTSIKDLRKLSRLGIRTLLLFIGTTLAAVCIGFGVAAFMQVGTVIQTQSEIVTPSTATGLNINQFLFNIIPSNPIAALAEGNSLQILVFALLFGLAINMVGEKGQPIQALFDSMSHVMQRLIGMMMNVTPYAVFAIMAWVGGTFGWQILHALFKFVVAIYLASILHMVFIFGGILLSVKLNPLKFVQGMKDAIIFAFTSSSSSATLPISMVCAANNLGVSRHIAHFVLPLGAAINMNGTAIFHAISALFIAQIYGIQLDVSHFITIAFAATISSIGTAGAPGSGLLILGTVLASVGLPLEGLTFVWGVDRIRDMIGTVVNILGDAIIAVFLCKKEGELDEQIYYADNSN